MNSVTDIEKKRARKAYEYVTKANENEIIKGDYKSYVKKIPMMILNNGLGATFAFIYSKKKNGNAYEVIYSQIQEWLKTDKDLVEWIIHQDSQEYRATTNEVLALFNWLKRFADGMIEDKKDG
jgi:CRISPR-associated protein Cmr5